MRVGMVREHHEVMVVVTAGLIEGRKRISVTATFADVGKVVAEMLARFEFNFFADRVGDRAAHRVPRSAEQDVLGPDHGSRRIRLEPTDFVDCFRLCRCRELAFQGRFQFTVLGEVLSLLGKGLGCTLA